MTLLAFGGYEDNSNTQPCREGGIVIISYSADIDAVLVMLWSHRFLYTIAHHDIRQIGGRFNSKYAKKWY